MRDAGRLPRIPTAEWPLRQRDVAPACPGAFSELRDEYLRLVERMGRTLGADEDWMPTRIRAG